MELGNNEDNVKKPICIKSYNNSYGRVGLCGPATMEHANTKAKEDLKVVLKTYLEAP